MSINIGSLKNEIVGFSKELQANQTTPQNLIMEDLVSAISNAHDYIEVCNQSWEELSMDDRKFYPACVKTYDQLINYFLANREKIPCKDIKNFEINKF